MQPCSFLSTIHTACGSLPPLRQLCRCPPGTQQPWTPSCCVLYSRTLLFLCRSQSIILQDRNVCARAWDTTFLPETQGFHTNWKNLKNIFMCSGSPRTNKSQQESPNGGENILSLLAHRPELDNILLFFLSIFHHSSTIIEETETKGQGNG